MRQPVPLEAFSRTEKVIALCRVVLALGSLAVVAIDDRMPAFSPWVGHGVLLSYAVFSVVLFWLIRGEYVRQEKIGYFAAAADITWVSLITLFTESGANPFFVLHVFVISSVSVRWGLAGAVPVTLLLAVLYPILIYGAEKLYPPAEVVFQRRTLVRPVYLLAIGYLIGYLGEHERRSKRKLAFMLEFAGPGRGPGQPGLSLVRLMRRTLRFFEGEFGALVLSDPDTGSYFAWTLSLEKGAPRVGLRITSHDPAHLSFASASEGFFANDLRPGRRTALCYDLQTGGMERRHIPTDFDVPGTADTQALLVAPVLVGRALRGRAFVARRSSRKFTRDDLEFLLLLVGQAAASFEAHRLQQKAGEVAVLEERNRIARDLHDGYIQSLAAIDLRLAVCQHLLQKDPDRVEHELEELHQVVAIGNREVRHYLTVLRGERREPEDLGSTLDRLAAEFSIRERLQVHISHPGTALRLPPTTLYELTQIIREALQNAVRHGRATQAVVKLAARPTHVYLVVRDNGRGFESSNGSIDADGFLAPSRTPWSIRDRAAALGASLRVWSQAGNGAEVSLLIPVGGQPHERPVSHQEGLT